MTDMDQMDAAHEDLSSGDSPPASSRRVSGIGISLVFALLAGIFLFVDYSDIFFSNSRRRAALDLIKPGMRLTQAERVLNSAGYLTLYIEETPPVLQVSSLSRVPLTADLLHRFMPNSTPDNWLRAKLSGFTRFYVISELDGTVKFTSEGRPATFIGPEIML